MTNKSAVFGAGALSSLVNVEENLPMLVAIFPAFKRFRRVFPVIPTSDAALLLLTPLKIKNLSTAVHL